MSELSESVVDFCNALEAAVVKLRRQLEGKQTLEHWDANKIKWEQTEGSKGPYERSNDVDSVDFKNLVKDLTAHNGKLTRNGLFYWLFTNGVTVGRKKKGN